MVCVTFIFLINAELNEKTMPSSKTKHQENTGSDGLKEIDSVFDAGVANGTVKLYITKCGVSGPPDTGKSHIRALMLGLPRPKVRHSTTVATAADQATPDHKRFEFEDVVDMQTGKGNEWRVVKNDAMAKVIANTLHNEDYTSADGEVAQQTQTRSQHVKAYKFITNVKKQLKSLKGKRKQKRKGLNGIHLVYFVDTGGQPQFQEILPNFIKCDISLLVHNLSQALEYCPDFNYVVHGRRYRVPEQMKLSNIEIIEQTVRSINSSNFTTEQKPFVALLGTFKDKCNPSSPAYQQMLKDKTKKINEHLKAYIGHRQDKCGMFNPQRGEEQKIFAIDGSEAGWNSNVDILDKLRHFVLEYAKKKPVDVPIKYFIFLQCLLEYSTKKDYMTLEECNEVATSSNIFMEPSDVQGALMLFNKCNILLYFPKILEKIVFIKPGYLYCKVTELIAASFQCEYEFAITYNDFQNTGIFTDRILDTSGIVFSENFNQQDFLHLLEGLFIIAKLNPGRYFMPCVLPLAQSSNEELEAYRKCMSENDIDGPLIVAFHRKLSPKGLFCSSLVSLGNKPLWKLSNRTGGIFHRRNLVEFELKDADHIIGQVLVIDKGSHLEVYTMCEQQRCVQIKQSLLDALNKACDNLEYSQKDLYFTGFPCSSCSDFHSTVVFFDKEWKERCSIDCRKRPVLITSKRKAWFDDSFLYCEFL